MGSENGCCVALTPYYTYFEVARQAYLVERPGTVAPSNVRLDPQVDEFERSHLEPGMGHAIVARFGPHDDERAQPSQATALALYMFRETVTDELT